ncbi:DUF2087 domain-containing protein [Streptomyces sp. NBC_01497]|uniref:DUF2087 domain-containing protein n=1 Tax=Streptomyces sp. NBC_01497 TaxID=2903885 RepID=UPI002E2F608F|nr:DUF2087 domain-containing protein [Streptomyces sp. NBC_01497]
MTDDRTGSAHDVGALFSRGRLMSIPRRQARRDQVLRHLARTLFEPGRAYSEQEVNEALLTVHDDFPALRRFLVTSGLLERPRDGSSYRRVS